MLEHVKYRLSREEKKNPMYFYLEKIMEYAGKWRAIKWYNQKGYSLKGTFSTKNLVKLHL